MRINLELVLFNNLAAKLFNVQCPMFNIIY